MYFFCEYGFQRNPHTIPNFMFFCRSRGDSWICGFVSGFFCGFLLGDVGIYGFYGLVHG